MTTNTEMLDRLISLVRDNYVFPDVAAQIVADLETAAVDGTPDELAGAWTTRLQVVNHDRHLRVRRRRAAAGDGDTDWDAYYAADAVRNAGGVKAVSRTDDQTGRLEVAPYMSPVQFAEPYLRAAFDLLTGIERLVIDLRAGLGGTPETVAFICGYLLGDEPVHLQDMVDRDGNARQYWTTPAAGRFPITMPIAVLTSARTFSGAEELAYNLQALDRATIFGQRTGGGAHPVEVFDLSDDLEVSVPIARSVNVVTGANWEQIGVIPDVECEPEHALEQAQESFT
jgi:hypothetical protein